MGLFLGYLVVYFLTLIILVVFFDWTKRDVLEFFVEGLQFIFLPFIFLFVLVYDSIKKTRWDKRHLEVSQKKVYYDSIDFLYEEGIGQRPVPFSIGKEVWDV